MKKWHFKSSKNRINCLMTIKALAVQREHNTESRAAHLLEPQRMWVSIGHWKMHKVLLWPSLVTLYDIIGLILQEIVIFIHIIITAKYWLLLNSQITFFHFHKKLSLVFCSAVITHKCAAILNMWQSTLLGIFLMAEVTVMLEFGQKEKKREGEVCFYKKVAVCQWLRSKQRIVKYVFTKKC